MADDAEDIDIEDVVLTNAAGPKRVKGDMGEVEQHSLKDQIALADRAAAKKAAANRRRGLRFSKLVPPGTA